MNRNHRILKTLGLSLASALITAISLDQIEKQDIQDPFVIAGEIGLGLAGFGAIPASICCYFSPTNEELNNQIQPIE